MTPKSAKITIFAYPDGYAKVHEILAFADGQFKDLIDSAFPDIDYEKSVKQEVNEADYSNCEIEYNWVKKGSPLYTFLTHDDFSRKMEVMKCFKKNYEDPYQYSAKFAE